MKKIKAQILALRKVLHDHNYRYYVLDEPIISDYEFDQNLRELATLEKQYPEYHDPNSPTLRVGGGITKDFPTVVHEFPMYSLDNAYSHEEHPRVLILSRPKSISPMNQHIKNIGKSVVIKIHY